MILYSYGSSAKSLCQEFSGNPQNNFTFERRNMSDTSNFYTGILLTRDEQIRRKAESQDPIPIRLTNNYAFHRIFKKPEVCKGFLMALLHLQEADIQSVEISDPFQEGESRYSKEGILDIKIHLNGDRKINIEMQASYESDWSERSIFYLCRVYTEDLVKGEDYQKLEICIHVGILDFTLLTSPGFHHHIQLLDNKTHELYSDKFQIHVIELSKLNDPFPDEDRELYHWAKMIAAENLEVMQMEIQDDPNRQLVFDEAKYISLDPTQRYIYLREFLAAWDKRSQLHSAKQLGLTEGELRSLISLVQKKLQKGKSLAETAEELEDTEEHLQPLYEAARQHPDLTAAELAAQMMKKR